MRNPWLFRDSTMFKCPSSWVDRACWPSWWEIPDCSGTLWCLNVQAHELIELVGLLDEKALLFRDSTMFTCPSSWADRAVWPSWSEIPGWTGTLWCLNVQAHELIELVGLLNEKALIVQRLYDVRHFVLLEPQHLRHLSHLFQTKGVLKRYMKNNIIFLSNV